MVGVVVPVVGAIATVSCMTVAHPIVHAWFAAGGPTGTTTGAQNYDEFADETEITAVIAGNPVSALSIEMPHRIPANVGRPFLACLPDAVARLAAAKNDGHVTAATDVVAVYRITTPGRGDAYGLWCMVDTAEISTSAEEPGAVIRNEDVFPEKVRERVALAQALGHLLSPVLLLQTAASDRLRAALVDAASGTATVADRDSAGRLHEVWALAAGPERDQLLALAGAGELVVADGNHRSLAAQTAGLRRFLAVVTTPDSVTIDPYNRLISELPVTLATLIASLVEAGALVHQVDGRPATVPLAGTVQLYARGTTLEVTLPTEPAAPAVDNLDHALVERCLLGAALSLEPGDKRISYVGGDYPATWLCDEVDAGRSELAILIAPVTVDDFVAVNLARRRMPRKSTWFTPKARAGIVITDLSAEA